MEQTSTRSARSVIASPAAARATVRPALHPRAKAVELTPRAAFGARPSNRPTAQAVTCEGGGGLRIFDAFAVRG